MCTPYNVYATSLEFDLDLNLSMSIYILLRSISIEGDLRKDKSVGCENIASIADVTDMLSFAERTRC